MSRSSGVSQVIVSRHMVCDGEARYTFLPGTPREFEITWLCTFEGDTDVVIDPEVREASWTCDSCGTQHDLEWGSL